MPILKNAMFFLFALGVLFPHPSLSADSTGNTQTHVGALAWIEPKSRVITIGAPNVMEGARISELYVHEGDQVKEGQVLGVFSTFVRNKAALGVAQARLELAKGSLDRIIAGNKESDILSQMETIDSVKAREVAASQEHLRVKKLYDQKLVSKSRYDVAKSEHDRLTSERKAAEATLTSLSTVRPDDIRVAQLEVEVAQAQMDIAKADLDLSTIIAPIDGTVLTIHAHNAESVGNRGVLDMGDLTILDAVAEVDESEILRIKKGQSALIYITGLAEPVTGTVRDLGGQVKRNTTLDSDPSKLLDTRIVEVRIELAPLKNEQLKHLINMKVKAVINL